MCAYVSLRVFVCERARVFRVGPGGLSPSPLLEEAHQLISASCRSTSSAMQTDESKGGEGTRLHSSVLHWLVCTLRTLSAHALSLSHIHTHTVRLHVPAIDLGW